MFSRACLSGLCGFIFLTTTPAPDTLVLVTSQDALGANDSAGWMQLGPDGTVLADTFTAASVGGATVTGGLVGRDSLVSAVCPADPSCSWSGASAPNFNPGDSLIWTSDSGNGGNGPLTLTFSPSAAVGTAIQTDTPGAFTVQIDVYNGETLLGSLSEDSDASGNALFIGVIDQDGPNISKLVVSVPSCVGDCTDFAVGTLYLNTSVQPTAKPSLIPVLRKRAGHF